MSFLKDLKHLVVEEEEGDNKVEAPVAAPVATQQQQPTTSIPGLGGIGFGVTPAQPTFAAPSFTSPVATTPVTVSVDANLAGQYVAKLREKFTASPYSGVLTQFAATLDSLVEAIPEEGARFRAAMKVLAKQTNLTPEQLTAAYQSLIDILEGEAGKFQQGVGQMQAKEVTSREQNVQQINAAIESKNKEIQDLMQQRDQIGTDIVAAKQSIGGKVASFEGAVNSLRSEVNDTLQRLRIFFPAAQAAAVTKK
jgi:hypothetical protein